MPLRRSSEPLQRVSLYLFEADIKRLRELYTHKYTTFIRLLLRAHLTKRDAEIAAEGEALSDEIEFELDDIEEIDIGDDETVV